MIPIGIAPPAMLAAIEYVDQDPAFKDVKEMYSTTGNTFLLLHNNTLTNLEDANSYWVLNKVPGPIRVIRFKEGPIGHNIAGILLQIF